MERGRGVKKWMHRALSILAIALLVAVGAAAAGLSVRASWWGTALAWLREGGRATAGWTGVGLVLLGALCAATGWGGRRRTRFLSFEREGGAVSISTEAIADFVSKLAAEFPSVVQMRPEILPSRRGLDIRVAVRVRAGPQIHEVCDLLQRRVRESVAAGMGIAEVRRVEVSVVDIVMEHKPRMP
jgi:uncharacterized alkaline shock family protein YloU